MKLKIVAALLLISLLSICGYAQDNKLNNLDDVMKALESGKYVRAVFYYKKCQLISENEILKKVPDAIGGMTLDTFEYFAAKSIGNPEAYLSASESVLINHPSQGVIYNYAKVRIYASGKIRVIVQYLDPKTFEIKMNESFYTTIGDGAILYAK